MVPQSLIFSLILMKSSFSFEKLDTMTIDRLLSDPFHKSLYIPLVGIHQENLRKLADILNNIHNDAETVKKIEEPLKSHMQLVYGIKTENEPMRTRKREPVNQNEEMMRTRKREPLNLNEEMMRTRKRELLNFNEEMMRTRKRELLNFNEEMMRTRKREPLNFNEEMMRTRKREPLNLNEEMMRTRKREPLNHNEIINLEKQTIRNQKEEMFESCTSDQFIKYDLYTGNETNLLKRSNFYSGNNDHIFGGRHKRAIDQPGEPVILDPNNIDPNEIMNSEELAHHRHENYGGLSPIKRFDLNDTIIENFFTYDSPTLSHIVMEIFEQRSQENYDNAFLEVFKVINKDNYEELPTHEKVFLFRKFLRLYKEYNDETLRGVMFDLPKKMKNYAIEKFLNNNPKGKDFLSYWETEEEIDLRFRNLYQQFQHALIERNYEMEQQLYELACPKAYTQVLVDLTTNADDVLSFEREEKRLRAHARKYLRRKLNSAAMLRTTTASVDLEARGMPIE